MRNKILRIALAILVSGLILNAVYVNYRINSITNSIVLLSKTVVITANMVKDVAYTMKNFAETVYLDMKDIIENKIDDKINEKEENKFYLEQKLKYVNVEIANETQGYKGSGVTLKYNSKYYILSAAHLVSELTDIIALYENGEKICELEIIKDDGMYINEDGTIDEGTDLLLLRPKDQSIMPFLYVELAPYEPVTGTEIYIVGNPMVYEDVITEGRIVSYEGNIMMITDNIYHGNSGGGVYTKNGKLLGIVSYYRTYKAHYDSPYWTVYGIVRLATINAFLEGVE